MRRSPGRTVLSNLGRLATLTVASGAALTLAGGLLITPTPERPSLVLVSREPDGGDTGVECVILRRDGSEVSGILVERGEEEIVLRVAGIRTAVKREQIADVRFLPPVEERYERLKAAIDDTDVDGRLHLAEWLRDRERYQLALDEVMGVLEIEPYDKRARNMRTWLEAQLKLSKRGVGEDRGEVVIEASGDEREKKSFPLLSRDEINLIRVYEVDLSNPPKMLIGRDIIQRLMEENASSDLIPATREGREALFRAPPQRVLELMFRLQARELYKEVRVLEDPDSMRRFKQDFHGAWFVNACASSRCHGGEQAGRLWVNDKHVNSDQTAYTNFLILDQFRLDDGTPLINWAEPARSPLLQMALPKGVSLYPHPEVGSGRGTRAWRPVFRSTDDRRFQDALTWIDSMYRPRPDYRLDYKAPVPSGERQRDEAGMDEDEPIDR
ncbi:MAG: hypothetical protein R3B57_01950 [Phycisphaerales bacterium]